MPWRNSLACSLDGVPYGTALPSGYSDHHPLDTFFIRHTSFGITSITSESASVSSACKPSAKTVEVVNRIRGTNGHKPKRKPKVSNWTDAELEDRIKSP